MGRTRQSKFDSPPRLTHRRRCQRCSTAQCAGEGYWKMDLGMRSLKTNGPMCVGALYPHGRIDRSVRLPLSMIMLSNLTLSPAPLPLFVHPLVARSFWHGSWSERSHCLDLLDETLFVSVLSAPRSAVGELTAVFELFRERKPRSLTFFQI